MGIVDWQDVARIFDENPFEFKRRLIMSKNSDMDKYLISLMSLNNQSNKNGSNPFNEKKIGRPAQPDSTNDSTANSQARGSNELASEVN